MTEHVFNAARHETSDVTPRSLAYAFAAILLSLLALGGFLFWLFPHPLLDRTVTMPLPAYPAPRLQADPAAEMQHFHADELRQLDSLSWRDRGAGTVHLPIADAMRAVVAHGIPDWPKPTAPPQ